MTQEIHKCKYCSGCAALAAGHRELHTIAKPAHRFMNSPVGAALISGKCLDVDSTVLGLFFFFFSSVTCLCWCKSCQCSARRLWHTVDTRALLCVQSEAAKRGDSLSVVLNVIENDLSQPNKSKRRRIVAPSISVVKDLHNMKEWRKRANPSARMEFCVWANYIASLFLTNWDYE